jgi:hypothetical protein
MIKVYYFFERFPNINRSNKGMARRINYINLDSRIKVEDTQVRYRYKGYTVALEYEKSLAGFNLMLYSSHGNKSIRIALIKRAEISGKQYCTNNLLYKVKDIMFQILPDERHAHFEDGENVASRNYLYAQTMQAFLCLLNGVYVEAPKREKT